MAIEAIALLKLTRAQMEAAFPAKGAERPGADGKPLKLSALEDAVLLTLGASFDLEPDEASALLRARLGAALDQHDDPRGVLVIPDKARPGSKRYDEAVEEVGDLGFWARKVGADFVPAPRPAVDESADEDLDVDEGDADRDDEAAGDNPFGGAMKNLLGGGGLSPDVFAQAQAMLSGPGGADLFAMAQRQVAAMMAEPGGFDALAKGLADALGADGIDPEFLKQMMPEKLPTPEEMQAMLAQGQQDLEELKREDPARAAALESRFGSMLGGEKKPG
jgi:hypothetical protein